MCEVKNTPVPEGAVKCAQKAPKIYEIRPCDRWYLAAALVFCVLLADSLLWGGRRGAVVSVVVGAWYVLVLAYTGPAPLLVRSNRVLLLCNLFLALSMALTSSPAFRTWNCMALLALVPLHTVSLSGSAQLAWWQPAMVAERFSLLLQGLFGHLGAPAAVLLSGGKSRDSRRILTAAAGLFCSLALLTALVPVLMSADALFSALGREVAEWVEIHVSAALRRFLWGAVLTPMVFGLLYSLRRSKAAKETVPAAPKPGDGLFFLPVLTALAVLYLAFLAVQSAGLFGGADYLAAKGLSYAEWARSGFFQIVGVTAVNLLVIMAVLGLTEPNGRFRRPLRLLLTALVAESLVLLFSAAWRMSLYVGAYGLSFKRFMTYWGMGMMALFLLLALYKILRPAFSYCRAAIPLALAGWLLINCVPVDYLVAADQVERYLSGRSESISVEYLVTLSYDTLHPLERLAGQTVYSDYSGPCEIDPLLAYRRSLAEKECADWHSWSLSAWFAAN